MQQPIDPDDLRPGVPLSQEQIAELAGAIGEMIAAKYSPSHYRHSDIGEAVMRATVGAIGWRATLALFVEP